MKFLKKNVKVIVIAIVGMMIGMLITGGIVFAAVKYNASEIKYDTTSVAGALDNLYNYAKNKSDLAEQMQKPNTWTVGTEYDFGDGVYGQRFTGTYTAAANADANAYTDKKLSNISIESILNHGGWFDNGSGVKIAISGSAAGQSTNYRASEILYSSEGLILKTFSSVARTNAPYDVWVLYTK